MFTGIIEETGTIAGIERGARSCRLSVLGDRIFADLTVGDSVSTNGVCLTATSVDASSKIFTADVMNETLSRSSLGALQKGSRVNLERALCLTDRLGGHIVSGHIDGTGTVRSIKKDDIAVRFRIACAPEILRLIVEKGSIAIDGISLTVSDVTRTDFEVSVIPHTAVETTLGDARIGTRVNLENDIIGKYVEKLTANSGGLTREFLMENGFF